MRETGEKNGMDESLIPKEREESESSSSSLTWDVFFQEVKRVGWIAAPMVAVNLSLLLLQVISMMMSGHLGELSLSSAAIAVSLSGVTGFSVLLGMASALETLCGQAYGARQYHKLGTQTYTAMFSLILVCLPLSLIWINMGKILVLIGQDSEISREAGRFTTWLVPGLFAYAILQPLIRFFQMQSLIFPMFLISIITVCLHIPLCWVLVFMSRLENHGAAFALSISLWLNVIFLGLYMKFSSACAKTRAPISMELFRGVGEFFHFAIPSAAMICLEWWSYELLVLLSGLLPNPQLETSVLSVCTRISNELGAGHPESARIVVYALMFLAVIETTIVSSTIFASRHVFGYTFSNEKEVVDYVTVMSTFICISIILDSLQGVLSGVARGCGWQRTGAYINLAAFYLCGIPCAAMLGFWANLGGKGLWMGIQIGAFTQTILLFIVTGCTNWEKQANKARERACEGNRNGLAYI
ncbi:protein DETOXIFICATION 12-like isoform X2 [Tripterygium wilfordii]|uniref:protein DETOXIFICATION 12-like isoform X2 n=1 Tax=Tripterygium wilfordii TaxID=458696 RepID=UPI0018F84AE5|nr:protein DETOXIFICATION 12-like isoform X2 [Tripterygium wilfordii]